MGFSRQEYWSGLPCTPLGNLPNLGIEPATPMTPVLQVGSLPLSHLGNPSTSESHPNFWSLPAAVTSRACSSGIACIQQQNWEFSPQNIRKKEFKGEVTPSVGSEYTDIRQMIISTSINTNAWQRVLREILWGHQLRMPGRGVPQWVSDMLLLKLPGSPPKPPLIQQLVDSDTWSGLLHWHSGDYHIIYKIRRQTPKLDSASPVLFLPLACKHQSHCQLPRK